MKHQAKKPSRAREIVRAVRLAQASTLDRQMVAAQANGLVRLRL
jgi:hypothetical protein